MKTYIVISLTVGGLGNKIFNYGDIVNESNFPSGNADKLVEQGFLKESDETVLTETDKTETMVPDYDSVTKGDLIITLTEKEIKFPKDSTKQELFDLAYPSNMDTI
jgi:hypothetical protein